ncbi:MFS transporter [Egicoccus sp. AB-alg2]|uniref:MFS transporter n=1 Tax=Egicoccus sp. AB-alg2 TaxID=3242693 RepID=UPI00359D1F19
MFRNRDFSLYWCGVMLSEIGVRGTFVVNLYHVYDLTRSTALVSVVGVVQGLALVTLSPLGGVIADRVDRRRLLQGTQFLSLVASLTLGLLSVAGAVEAWHIYITVLVNTAASTFDSPTRTALIPALVPREQLAQAFAIVNPTRELAVLLGPALGGALIAIGGPGLMYLLDAATYLALVLILPMLRIPAHRADGEPIRVWRRMAEGARFIRGRPVILQFLSLDLATTLLAGWRAVLPALAVEVLRVGEVAYGLLAAAPSAGALVGTAIMVRWGNRALSGSLVLAATAAYGSSVMGLALAPAFALAVAAAVCLGATDAVASVVRHSAVQLETPDHLRGRVTSLYQVAVRGGPAIGDANVGWVSALLGPANALALGGILPLLAVGGYGLWGRRLRTYRVAT